MRRAVIFFVSAMLALGMGAFVRGQQPNPPPSPAAQTERRPELPMDAVLLKDYRPQSSLIVPEHHPLRARIRAIDAHAHAYARTPDDVAKWVRLMDEVGIETTIVLTNVVGAEFETLAQLYKPYAGRFQVYCGIDTSNPDAADYPDRAVASLLRCRDAGAVGVGEITDKGAGLTPDGPSLPRERRLHVDDPRLDPFWRKCAELGLPVNLHVADHPSAWRPPDEHQERPPFFQRYNVFGKDVLSFDELIARRNQLFRRHPDTRFVAAHLGNQGHDLAALAKVLDEFPRLVVDLSARDYELGRQPRTAAKFLSQYKNRVLFGSDMGAEKSIYLGWWRLLETPDEYVPNMVWRLYGLDLPVNVLERLYRQNYEALVGSVDRRTTSRPPIK